MDECLVRPPRWPQRLTENASPSWPTFCTGHNSLRRPVGEHKRRGQRPQVKVIPFIRISDSRIADHPNLAKGRYRDRHDTRDGTWWTQAASARRRFAGRSPRERRPRAHDRRSQRTAKSCGPCVRSLCAKSCGDVRSNRACMSVIRKATGATVHCSPGRSRHKP
jgi:hypothetical protein